MGWVAFGLIGAAVVVLVGVVWYMEHSRSQKVAAANAEAARAREEAAATIKAYEARFNEMDAEGAKLRVQLGEALEGNRRFAAQAETLSREVESLVRDKAAEQANAERYKARVEELEANAGNVAKNASDAMRFERDAALISAKNLAVENETLKKVRLTIHLKSGGQLSGLALMDEGTSYRIFLATGGETSIKKDMVEKIDFPKHQKATAK